MCDSGTHCTKGQGTKIASDLNPLTQDLRENKRVREPWKKNPAKIRKYIAFFSCARWHQSELSYELVSSSRGIGKGYEVRLTGAKEVAEETKTWESCGHF